MQEPLSKKLSKTSIPKGVGPVDHLRWWTRPAKVATVYREDHGTARRHSPRPCHDVTPSVAGKAGHEHRRQQCGERGWGDRPYRARAQVLPPEEAPARHHGDTVPGHPG